MGFSKRNRKFFLTVGGWIHHEFLQGGVLRRNSLKDFLLREEVVDFLDFQLSRRTTFFWG